MKKFNKQKAFTLVELSIVLVIIGLLTAGVVGGQSLIESAKRQRLATDLTGIVIANNAFKLEYDQMPGDFSTASSYWPTCLTKYADASVTTCNGNGNGKISDGGEWMEVHGFWVHLGLANILPENYISNNAHRKSPFADNGIMFVTYNDFFELDLPLSNNIVVTKWGTTQRDALLTAANAKKIDQKIDDGLPTTGTLVAMNGQSNSGNCLSSTAYNLTNTGIACVLGQKLD